MFYEKLKHKIEYLLAHHQYQAALHLIDEELKAPYIPPEFEFFLTQNRLIIHEKLNLELKPKPLIIDSKLIISMLKSNDKNQYLLAIEAFKEINIRKIMPAVQEFLLRSDVTNDVKSLALMALKQQEINHVFKLKHHSQLSNINPQDLNIKKLSDFNQKVVTKLNDIFFQNNQTLNDLAIKIALLFLLDVFPENFDFTIEDVVAMSIKRSAKMLNIKVTWDQIKSVLNFDLKKAKTIFLHQLPSLD